MNMYYVYMASYISLAVVMQPLTGNLLVSFPVFPLSIIFAVIWLFLLWTLYKEYNNLGITRFLGSFRVSVLSISLFISGCLIIELFPQLSEPEAEMHKGISASLGCYNSMISWISISTLLLLLSDLAMVTIHARRHRKQARWYFILNHTGLWLALSAGFLGNSDAQVLRMPLYKGEPKHEAFDVNGISYYLDYDMKLNSLAVEYYPNRRPSRLSVNVRLRNENAPLEVNHPYSYRLGEDVYLIGYGVMKGNESNYCIPQVVKQPWKYVTVASILVMLAEVILLFIDGAKMHDKPG